MLPRLISAAAEPRLLALYAFSTAVKQGRLISYLANFFETWRHLARQVDHILDQATEVTLAINLKTAKALGLSLSPTLLTTAGEVIE